MKGMTSAHKHALIWLLVVADVTALFAASKTIQSSDFQALLKPIDIFAPPEGAKKLISLKDLYQTVKTQGVSIKIASEELNSAKQSQIEFKKSYLPTLTLTGGSNQTWTKTRSDSDLTDDYSDRDKLKGSRSITHRGDLSLSGNPVQGVDYSLSTPGYSLTQNIPDDSDVNPRRPHKSSFTASLGIELLKGSPLLISSPTKKKQRTSWLVAKEKFRADTLKGLAAAEKSFYALIQRHLQLMVQRRGFQLAKALEADVKEKIAAGESSSLEAVRASLSTSQTETDLMTAEIDFQGALEEFRASLNLDGVSGVGVFPDPKTLSVDVEKLSLPGAEAINELKKQNLDIQSARYAVKIAEYDLEIARKGRAPSLKFTSSLDNGGPGENFPSAYRDSLKPNDQTYSVGLSFSQVLYNDKSSDSYKTSIVQKQKAELNLDKVERDTVKTFNALTKKIEISQRRNKIARISREIAEQKLAAEYEKFRYGESSVRNVIDTQTEVNSARIAEISSRIELLSSFSELRVMLGKPPEGVLVEDSAGFAGGEDRG